jgi:hypothetical protein
LAERGRMLVFSWANEKEALGVLAIEIELAGQPVA